MCPCCASVKVRDLGRLQDSHWFAGVCIDPALPGGRLYSCLACGMKFRHPLLEPEKYAQLYIHASSAVWASATRRADFQLILEYVKSEFQKGARILDYGCYTGDLLSRFGTEYETNGVEISDAAAEIAGSRITGRIWHSLDEIPPSERFDVIVASDVIEHMADPVVTFASLAERLNSNGRLVLTTGDADSFLWRLFGANWWYCFYPEHVRFFSRRTVTYIADRLALSVVQTKQFRHAGLRRTRRLVDGVQACWFGVFPASYLALMGWIRRIRGCSKPLSSMPGNGVTRDHLFLALRRNDDADAS